MNPATHRLRELAKSLALADYRGNAPGSVATGRAMLRELDQLDAKLTTPPKLDGATSSASHHRLEVVSYGGELFLRLACTAAPDAYCRQRPTDTDRETWGPDDDTTPGHECWAVEWQAAAGFADAVRWDHGAAADLVLGGLPVAVSYDEGVVLDYATPDQPTLELATPDHEPDFAKYAKLILETGGAVELGGVKISRIEPDIRVAVDRVDITQHATASGRAHVNGKCPACGSGGLFVGSGGYLTCPWAECPDPGAPHDALVTPAALHTRDQLDALPLTAVVLDRDGAPHIHDARNAWSADGRQYMTGQIALPATVVYTPKG